MSEHEELERYDESDGEGENMGGNRPRLASKDIARTYSGLYGTGGDAGDLLPFELSRNRNTDWVDSGGWSLLSIYVGIIVATYLLIVLMGSVALFPDHVSSWSATLTNGLHALVTLTYLHWIKGSPNFYEQGEMNGMTLWEQLDSKSQGVQKHNSNKTALFVVPTLLTYAACHACNYAPLLSLLNISIWLVCIVAKLPFMNGVRLLGINRTAGIDDDDNDNDNDEPPNDRPTLHTKQS
eukprot:CAMPEP_0198289218 /NCGR_PEP_ID=MMETSP1449-20131203/7482_1 /TAXON_ID=420275 /ORGANISM="Attheya septentrionalis, Strain CCMP2084" /LENGTH=237 /DNA_ID=CAMNT_0043987515 /DNA_START=261 /DNA_END=977 /DNA_ORIENTATION=+